jgi:uncharacterized coiled-coil protein SlyX
MAIPWLTVLKVLPWQDVVANAPKLIDGAKKLWSATKARPQTLEQAAGPKPGLDAVDDRLARLEAAVAEQHQQLQASSDLIRELADQNAQLIRRIEANRVRLRWVTIVLALAAAAAVTALFR